MAIDFPNSPTVGQIFTAANGTSWQWNGTAWVAAGTATGLITGAPNKLINPFMEIDQANEGAAVNISASGYIVDGWQVLLNAGAVGAQRGTIPPSAASPFSFYIALQVNTTAALVAGTYAQLTQYIEAEEIQDTCFGSNAAKSLVVSFWVQSSVTGVYSAAIVNSPSNRSYVFNFTLTTANIWQNITQVIPGDTAGTWSLSGNTTGMGLRIVMAVGTTYQGTANTWQAGTILGTSANSNNWMTTAGAAFRLGPCGLWVAPAAQPLLRTSFQAELARCQRYYEKSYDLGVKPGTAGANAVQWTGAPNAAGSVTGSALTTLFKVTKRASPTMTSYDSAGDTNGFTFSSSGGGWTNGGVFSTVNPATQGSRWYTSNSTITSIAFDFVADARL